jgi:hypothetical protein
MTMSQQLALDRTTVRFYYVGSLVVLLVTACSGRPSSIAPANLSPLEESTARSWAAELQPSQAVLYDLRWTYTTQKGSTRGRATVRFAPPDSLRFDYRAPFGRSGAAVVVGDSVIWAEPEEDVDQLIPVAPLFWAALGIPRDAPAGSRLYGLQTGSQRIWQYVSQGDTLSYVMADEPQLRLQAQVRRFDEVIGTTETILNDSTRVPEEATMTFPGSASLFLLNVVNVETLASHDPDVWKRP